MLLPRLNCEPGEDEKAQGWIAEAQTILGQKNCAPPAPASSATSAISRASPYEARLVVNRRLNAPGSEKETRQFAFELNGSGLSYQPGDALGVWPENDPALLEDIARRTGLAPEMLEGRDVTRLTPPLLAFYAQHAPKLAALLAAQDVPARKNWLWGRQLLDVLLEFPCKAQPEDWLAA